MIKSMTGFASVTREDQTAAVGVTVKTVNHRFLDVQLRMPGSLAPLEPRIRAIVQGHVARGRAEIAITVQPRAQTQTEVELNEPFIAALKAAVDRARQIGLVEGQLTAADLLRFPQAIAVREKPDTAPIEASPIADLVERTLSEALDELDRMRAREGTYLQADLDARRGRLGELFERVASAAEEGMAGLQARLAERVRELRADALADEAAVAQEIAKFVGRSDITEEVVRFRGHLDHWQALSESPEPCGRKLDFLLQEMNREVNTAGSKAEGPAVSELIVALKADLEKVREQVQNVE
jgi:uncharacterized protein (TIGR00255 family)